MKESKNRFVYCMLQLNVSQALMWFTADFLEAKLALHLLMTCVQFQCVSHVEGHPL